MAKLLSINISKVRGIPKESIDKAELKINHGIVGDAHAENWHRQISMLAQESIDKMIQKGVKGLYHGAFAENLTTEGINLYTLPIGTQLKIGECLVEVTQIGKECHHHCAIYKQIGDCVMPREGIFVKVLSEGTIYPGDEIEIVK